MRKFVGCCNCFVSRSVRVCGGRAHPSVSLIVASAGSKLFGMDWHRSMIIDCFVLILVECIGHWQSYHLVISLSLSRIYFSIPFHSIAHGVHHHMPWRLFFLRTCSGYCWDDEEETLVAAAAPFPEPPQASLMNFDHWSRTTPSLPYHSRPFRWSSVSSGATKSPPNTSDQQKCVTLSNTRDSVDSPGMPNAEKTGVTPSPS